MLPKIMPLSREVELPISKKRVRVYAFKIAEEKLLLLHKDATEQELEDIIIELIRSKTDGVDVDTLTMVDIIVLFLNIVDISRGVNRHFTYKCNTRNEEGNKCGTLIEVDVNMADYKIVGEVQNNKLVTVGDGIVVELEYPAYKVIRELSKKQENEVDYIIRLYSKLIVAVYQGEEAYTDFDSEEIYQWTLDLPHTVLKEFDDFIASIPEIVVEYDVICPKCGTSDHYTVKNIIDFFTYDTQTKM